MSTTNPLITDEQAQATVDAYQRDIRKMVDAMPGDDLAERTRLYLAHVAQATGLNIEGTVRWPHTSNPLMVH